MGTLMMSRLSSEICVGGPERWDPVELKSVWRVRCSWYWWLRPYCLVAVSFTSEKPLEVTRTWRLWFFYYGVSDDSRRPTSSLIIITIRINYYVVSFPSTQSLHHLIEQVLQIITAQGRRFEVREWSRSCPIYSFVLSNCSFSCEVFLNKEMVRTITLLPTKNTGNAPAP